MLARPSPNTLQTSRRILNISVYLKKIDRTKYRTFFQSTTTILPRTLPKLANPTKSKSPPRSLDKNLSQRVQLLSRHLSTSPTSARNITDMAPTFGVRKIGAPNTFEHRVYVEMNGQPVSAFHDVPLYADEQQTILNMIVEIPRWTNAKLEVSLSFQDNKTVLIRHRYRKMKT